MYAGGGGGGRRKAECSDESLWHVELSSKHTAPFSCCKTQLSKVNKNDLLNTGTDRHVTGAVLVSNYCIRPNIRRSFSFFKRPL